MSLEKQRQTSGSLTINLDFCGLHDILTITFTHSKSDRMAWVGSDIRGQPLPFPLLWAGPPSTRSDSPELLPTCP